MFIESFFVKFLNTFFCFLRIAIKDKMQRRFPYSKNGNEKSIIILANGPSLKDSLKKIMNEPSWNNAVYSVHNFFGFSEEFPILKPSYYALADPMFYQKNHRYEEVKQLFSLFNEKIDWPLNLLVVSSKKTFVEFSGITNPNITIIPVQGRRVENIRLGHSGEASSWAALDHWLYKKGYACPGYFTVAQMNIFCAINSGFKAIYVYGIDHSFFESLSVNNNNELCNKSKHYYDTEEQALKPILRYDGKNYSMSEFLFFNGILFKSHEQLNNYAFSVGAKIYNCTKGSLVDCYERIS